MNILIILFFSFFSVYFTNSSEFISKEYNTNIYLTIYFIIYFVIYLIMINCYTRTHQKIIKHNFLLIVSFFLFFLTIFTYTYTIDKSKEIYENFDGSNKEIPLKVQSEIFRENLSELKNLNFNIFIGSLVLSYILNLTLDFYLANKENKRLSDYIKLLTLNFFFYLTILPTALTLYFIISVVSFFIYF